MIFHWRAAEMTLRALTRQPSTFTRASTTTATDSAGATATYPQHYPAYQITGGRVGVLTSSEDWRYAFLARPQALTVYLKFVERGSVNTDVLLWIGATGATSPYFRLLRASNGYQSSHHNGSVERTSSLSAAPSSGQVVQVRATLAATGATQIFHSINGASEVSATESSTAALASAWSGQVMMVGSRITNNPANVELRVIKIAAGVRSLAYMVSAF
jgi:hypothetical protein